MKYIISIIYLICTTGGITFMKMGGDSLSLSFKNGFTFKIGFLTFIGFALYLISFILWQRLVVLYDLTFIVPLLTGLVQIIVLLIGISFFKEQINPGSIIGAIMIISGIIIIAFSKLK